MLLESLISSNPAARIKKDNSISNDSAIEIYSLQAKLETIVVHVSTGTNRVHIDYDDSKGERYRNCESV